MVPACVTVAQTRLLRVDVCVRTRKNALYDTCVTLPESAIGSVVETCRWMNVPWQAMIKNVIIGGFAPEILTHVATLEAQFGAPNQ